MEKNKINDEGYVIVRGDRSCVWKLEAKRNAADYIRELLKEEIDAGKVMVIR